MPRLLLLLPTTTYRTEDFVEAATRLGVDLVCASEKPSTLETAVPDHLVTLDFADAAGAADTAARFATRRPLDAVVGVDDLTAVAAAAIAERLGLRANVLAAVRAARDKHQMRQCLAAAGVRVPRFRRIALKDDPMLAARGVGFPCVLKPLGVDPVHRIAVFFHHHFPFKAKFWSHFAGIDAPFVWKELEFFHLLNVVEIFIKAIDEVSVEFLHLWMHDQFLIAQFR